MALQQIIDRILTLHAAYGALVETPDFTANALNQLTKKRLNALVTFFSEPHTEQEIIRYLKTCLKLNWDFVRGNALCYTAQPTADLTLLYCDIATWLAEQATGETPEAKAALSYLMPGLHLSGYGNYPPLSPPNTDNQCLPVILATHILGSGGKHLIPIDLLLRWNPEEPTSQQKIPDPYWNEDCLLEYEEKTEHGAENEKPNGYLTQKNIHSLFAHSDLTQRFDLAIGKYKTALSEDDSLLSQLKALCRQLYLNSVDGIGTETVAAKGADKAIEDFNQFWQKLTADQHKGIPEPVSNEIKTLLALYLGTEEKIDVDYNRFDHCIKTRRQHLQELVSAHEDTLAGIRLSEDTKNSRLEETRQKVETARENLRAALEWRTYTGSDPLFLTQSVLDGLDNADFHISTREEIQCLRQFAPDAIRHFIKYSPVLKDQILNQIETREDLVMLCFESPPHLLRILLESIGDVLSKKLHNSGALITHQHLAACLEFVSEEVCEALCLWQRNGLLRNAPNMVTLLGSLTPGKRLWLCRKIGVFSSNFDLDGIMQVAGTLTPEEQQIAWPLMQNDFHRAIDAWSFEDLKKTALLLQKAIEFPSPLPMLEAKHLSSEIIKKLSAQNQERMISDYVTLRRESPEQACIFSSFLPFNEKITQIGTFSGHAVCHIDYYMENLPAFYKLLDEARTFGIRKELFLSIYPAMIKSIAGNYVDVQRLVKIKKHLNLTEEELKIILYPPHTNLRLSPFLITDLHLMVKSGLDLFNALYMLPDEEWDDFLTKKNLDRILAMPFERRWGIPCEQRWGTPFDHPDLNIMQFITAAECTQFWLKISKNRNLFAHTRCTYYFNIFLQSSLSLMSDEQCSAVFTQPEIQEFLNWMVRNLWGPSDLTEIMRILNSREKRCLFLTALINPLYDSIALNSVFECFLSLNSEEKHFLNNSPSVRDYFNMAVSQKAHDDKNAYAVCLRLLSTAEALGGEKCRAEYFGIIQSAIIQSINDSQSPISALGMLHYKTWRENWLRCQEWEFIFSGFKENLLRLVKSPDDLIDIKYLLYPSDYEWKNLFNNEIAMNECISRVIQSQNDFDCVSRRMKYPDFDPSDTILRILHENAQNGFLYHPKNTDELCQTFRKYRKYRAFDEILSSSSMEDTLFRIVQTADDLEKVSPWISNARKNALSFKIQDMNRAGWPADDSLNDIYLTLARLYQHAETLCDKKQASHCRLAAEQMKIFMIQYCLGHYRHDEAVTAVDEIRRSVSKDPVLAHHNNGFKQFINRSLCCFGITFFTTERQKRAANVLEAIDRTVRHR